MKTYIVKKGAEAAKCPRNCGTDVYWIEAPRSTGLGTMRVPVDTDVDNGITPDSFTEGRGINHFEVCGAHG